MSNFYTQTYTNTDENVSSGDLNLTNALALQTHKNFNKYVISEKDCVLSGLQVVAPTSPSTGAVTVNPGYALYASPTATTTVPNSSPSSVLSLQGSIIEIDSTVTIAITTPNPTYGRIDTIDLIYSEIQSVSGNRNFINPTTGAISLTSTPTRTVSNSIQNPSLSNTNIVYTEGAPSSSPTAPTIPPNCIRLATILVPAGSYNIIQSNIAQAGSNGTTGVSGTIPRIWELQSFPSNPNNPLNPEGAGNFDQSVTLSDSLSSIRYQLNQIIGATNWYSDVPISLTTLADNPGASPYVKTGAELIYYSSNVLIISPGTIGFPDGTVRTNTGRKTINFSSTFNVGTDPIFTTSVNTGYLQSQGLASIGSYSNVGLETYSHYAIFATANHTGTDFNVWAAKVPYFKGVTGTNLGGGTWQYSVGSLPNGVPFSFLFYPGQEIMAYSQDSTLTSIGPGSYSLPSAAYFTSYSQEYPEFISPGAVGTTFIQTTTGNPSINPPGVNNGNNFGGFSNGNLTVNRKLQPNVTLTGISGSGYSRFRLLGLISTDASANIRNFVKTGILTDYCFLGDNFWNLTNTNSPVTYGVLKELSLLIPPPAKKAKLNSNCIFYLSSYNNVQSLQGAALQIYTPGSNYPTAVSHACVLSQQIGGSGILATSGSSTINAQVPTLFNVINIAWANDNSYAVSVQVKNGITDATGYEFDIFDEWGRQNSTGGFN